MLADPQPRPRPLHPGRRSGERSRGLLLALITANPGLHVLRAAHLLGLNWHTCLHHVRRLEGERRITVRKLDGRLCLFDRREGAAAHKVAPLLLRDPRNADVARAVMEAPGANQKGLAQRLGLAASVVHRRLLRLEEAGLVQRAPQERSISVFPTPALEAAWPSVGLFPEQATDPTVPWTAQDPLAAPAVPSFAVAAAPADEAVFAF
ncbi:MAG: winged helix-turn-helix transcriptional regulator [Halobacteriales archaeon]|nr:winged helix-turn-helix transcriptional regulator [Halobacteriales archaeon]